MNKPYIVSLFDVKSAFSLLNKTLPDELTVDLSGKKWFFKDLAQIFLNRCEYVKRVEPLSPKVLFVFNNLKQTELIWMSKGFSNKQKSENFVYINNSRIDTNSLSFKIAEILIENPNISFEELVLSFNSLKSKKNGSSTAYNVWRNFQIFMYLLHKENNG